MVYAFHVGTRVARFPTHTITATWSGPKKHSKVVPQMWLADYIYNVFGEDGVVQLAKPTVTSVAEGHELLTQEGKTAFLDEWQAAEREGRHTNGVMNGGNVFMVPYTWADDGAQIWWTVFEGGRAVPHSGGEVVGTVVLCAGDCEENASI